MVKRYLLLIIILLLVLMPLAYFFQTDQGLWWDEAIYLSLAKNTLEGKGYWVNVPPTDAFRPPLFPAMIVSIWALVGINEDIIRVLPVLFAVLGVFLTYLLGRELFGKEVGLISAFLLATSHLFLFYSDKILTESLFVLLSVLSLYVFLLGTKNKKNSYFMLFGVLASLSFLTRYAGAFLFVIYILYPIYLKFNKKSLYRLWGYWGTFIIFAVFLFALLSLHTVYYGSPFGGLFINSAAVDGNYYGGPWYFYFQNWLSIFGIIGIFALAGLCDFRKLNNNKIFFALFLIITLLFFMFLPRKEKRYLLHYFPLFLMLISLGIVWIKDRLKWDYLKVGLFIIVIILAGMNYYSGLFMLSSSEDSQALNQAGYCLANSSVTGKVLTNNMPVINYLSGREVVYFPYTLEELDAYIIENDVAFIVLQRWEPTYPDWVWDLSDGKKPSDVFDRFALEQTYVEYGMPNTWVYKV